MYPTEKKFAPISRDSSPVDRSPAVLHLQKILTANGALPLISGAAFLKVLTLPLGQDLSTFMGAYSTCSSIPVHQSTSGLDNAVSLMELVYYSCEVWCCQSSLSILNLGISCWSNWFVGHVNKWALNRMQEQGSEYIVC
jgi:hypothetical protein